MKWLIGLVLAIIGAGAQLVLFLFAPWLTREIGPVALASATGVELAGNGRALLFVAPIGALLAFALVFLHVQMELQRSWMLIGILVVTLVEAICVIIVIPSLPDMILGQVQFGAPGWGVWLTLISIGVTLAGGSILATTDH